MEVAMKTEVQILLITSVSIVLMIAVDHGGNQALGTMAIIVMALLIGAIYERNKEFLKVVATILSILIRSVL
jgi:hypothetical protein